MSNELLGQRSFEFMPLQPSAPAATPSQIISSLTPADMERLAASVQQTLNLMGRELSNLGQQMRALKVEVPETGDT